MPCYCLLISSDPFLQPFLRVHQEEVPVFHVPQFLCNLLCRSLALFCHHFHHTFHHQRKHRFIISSSDQHFFLSIGLGNGRRTRVQLFNVHFLRVLPCIINHGPDQITLPCIQFWTELAQCCTGPVLVLPFNLFR